MKIRVISTVIALFLALSLVVMVVAVDEQSQTSKGDPFTGTSQVSLSVTENPSTYTITIPPTITMATNNGTATGTALIIVSNYEIISGKELVVSITDSTNCKSGSQFYLNKGTDKIGYNIQADGITNNIAIGTTLISAEAKGDNTSVTLSFTTETINDTTPVGEYTDTLTFTASIVNAS